MFESQSHLFTDFSAHKLKPLPLPKIELWECEECQVIGTELSCMFCKKGPAVFTQTAAARTRSKPTDQPTNQPTNRFFLSEMFSGVV